VRSHYGDNPKHLKDREKIYAAGNGVAEWLGFDSWIDIPLMQCAERVEEFRTIIQSAQ
jgi:hypothetical protein